MTLTETVCSKYLGGYITVFLSERALNQMKKLANNAT